MNEKTPLFQRTVALVAKIPPGKVVSYGQVANLISAEGCARHVSYILSSSSKQYNLPWHRVISSSGKLSPHKGFHKQLLLLKKEGVVLHNNKTDLEAFGWKPSETLVRKILKGLPKHISIFEREGAK